MAYADGLITWADLNSPDVDASMAFYTGVFGWDAVEQFDPSGQIRVYVMFQKDGKNVVGLGGRQPGSMEGVPAFWTMYVNVHDIDAAAAAFVEHGGTAMMPEPMQVMENGWMFYGTDPSGAAIAMWKAGTHIGSDDFNKPGFMIWEEVMSRDLDAVIDFYPKVFGWEAQPMEGSDPAYWLFSSDGRMNAGAMAMPDTVPEEVPSHWMHYIEVEDVDAVVVKAEELGGTINAAPFDMGVGRIAVISDPHGAVFSVITSSTPPDPAPEQV
jgi:predicted enzyme related to lactoylglutathione lyase